MSGSGSIRAQRLRALGVQPLRLRGQPDEPAAQSDSVPAQTVQGAQATKPMAEPMASRCVLVLPASCPARTLVLVDRIMHAFGADFARAPRVKAGPDGLDVSPPLAPAYVVFGQPQARALGQALSSQMMQQAQVVLLQAPADLFSATAKREAWSALKALRRQMDAAA